MLPSLTPERLANPPSGGRRAGALARALDPAVERPKLRGDVEIGSFTTRWGERYAIAHSPASGAYLRLTGDEGDLARRLDGSRSLGELVVDGLDQREGLDPAEVGELVDALRAQSFFERGPVDVHQALRERLLPWRRRAAQRAWRWLRRQTITVPRADALVRTIYRAGGRLCFTLPANVSAVAVLVVGLAAFVLLARRGTYALTGRVSTGTALSLLGLGLVSLLVHEMGHALAVIRAGKRINNAGFQLYLGHPAFFIDSTDLLLAPRGARAVNALAGPYAEAVAAGAAAIAVWLGPEAAFAPLLFRFAGISYLTVLVNLIPFIELDGYWLLSDLLDVPRLRQRALAVLRYDIPDRARGHRAPLSRAERALAAFGIAGVVFTAAALLTAVTFWGPVVRSLVAALWRAGLGGRAVLVLLLGLVAGPLVVAAARVGRSGTRRLGALLGDLRFRVQTSWRVEAAHAVAALPVMESLDDAALSDLAGRVARRRVREGAAVVRQGEPADAFYVVRSGRFAVLERDAPGGERLVRRFGPGEAFGELALLERRPRTATVRAESDGELFVVDAGTFLRLLAPAMSEPELAPALWPVLEVWALPPFRHLAESDAALLHDRGVWVSRGPNEVVFRQGKAADGFYVVQTGQVEVLRDGRRVAVIGAGNHFGEVALLSDVPRTATVRTLTPARLFRIDAEAFRTLVAAAFARGTLRSATDAYEVSGAHR